MMTNPTGRVTQGQFSFLPDLSDAEIAMQIDYGLSKGYAWSVEYTDDPHPRNTYWEMFGMPMFDLKDAAGVMAELHQCRKAFPQHYIRMMAFDSTRGVLQVEHRVAVHLPVCVARVRIVGVLDAPRIALVQAVLDLQRDLGVAQVGQEAELALGQAPGGIGHHGCGSPCAQLDAVGVTA